MIYAAVVRGGHLICWRRLRSTATHIDHVRHVALGFCVPLHHPRYQMCVWGLQHLSYASRTWRRRVHRYICHAAVITSAYCNSRWSSDDCSATENLAVKVSGFAHGHGGHASKEYSGRIKIMRRTWLRVRMEPHCAVLRFKVWVMV